MAAGSLRIPKGRVVWEGAGIQVPGSTLSPQSPFTLSAKARPVPRNRIVMRSISFQTTVTGIRDVVGTPAYIRGPFVRALRRGYLVPFGKAEVRRAGVDVTIIATDWTSASD
jgi:hypothetical protein